jgi:two-component system, NarL family, response regulator DegU
MNLLIVEDNARMREMIKNIIRDLVDEIFECEDGQEAFTLYSDNQPDWVLMDIQMKNINGLTATQQILSKFANARIVVVTNYDDAHFRESARQAGAVDYVLKENLLDIRRILQAG